jgi:Mor family transcriptional regulator
MPVCNKCFIDKPQQEYYKEFRWGKFYYKKYCLDCFRKQARDWKLRNKLKKEQLIELPQQEKIIQPEVPELQPEVLHVQDGYKKCGTCEITKSKEDFYHSPKGTPFKNCKDCHVKNYKEKIVENNKDKGGSERVPYYPNQYADKYQKQQTFWVMELMGWTYNDNGVWSKEGIKDKNKVWKNLIETKRKIKYPNYRGGRKILPVYNKIEEVIKDYNDGNDFYELADIYECSHTTIRKLVKEYYDGK